MSTTVVHRSLTGARQAYDQEDKELARQLSRNAHSLLTPESPKGLGGGGFMEAGHNEEFAHTGLSLFLRGAVDGVIASTIVVSFVGAAEWSSNFDPVMGVGASACWAIFLASREALEVVTYRAHYSRERRREKWELENYPEGEVAEMVQLYIKKGLKEDTARLAVNAMASEPDFFVDVMMLEELQMAPPSELTGAQSAARVGGGCLVCGAAIPLTYAAFLRTVSPVSAYMLTMLFAVVALCYLGVRRAAITHMGKRVLAAQTASLLIPCLLLARFAGSRLTQLTA